jgi:hypothetical protein
MRSSNIEKAKLSTAESSDNKSPRKQMTVARRIKLEEVQKLQKDPNTKKIRVSSVK